MSYRAYHKETTRYLSRHPGVRTNHESFASAGAARAAITREARRGAIQAADFDVADSTVFHSSIEKTETVKNILSGQDVVQSVNTPWCCNPSSETYHSM
jgi:hypothetical protein